METMIEWHPPTLDDALTNGETVGLDYQPKTPGPYRVKYRCPCGAYVQSFRLLDLRGWPTPPQDWACDGCHSRWRRDLVDVTNTRTYSKQPDHRKWQEQLFLLDWLAAFNAPAAMIAAVQLRADALQPGN